MRQQALRPGTARGSPARAGRGRAAGCLPTVWRSAADYRASLSPPMAWLGLIVRSRGPGHAAPTRRAQPPDRRTGRSIGRHRPPMPPRPWTPPRPANRPGALHQCLGRLESKQREVVSLAYVRDLSHSGWPNNCACRWAPSKPGSAAVSTSCACAWRALPEEPGMNLLQHL